MIGEGLGCKNVLAVEEPQFLLRQEPARLPKHCSASPAKNVVHPFSPCTNQDLIQAKRLLEVSKAPVFCSILL